MRFAEEGDARTGGAFERLEPYQVKVPSIPFVWWDQSDVRMRYLHERRLIAIQRCHSYGKAEDDRSRLTTMF